MPHFSNKSQAALETCHPLLQQILVEAIKTVDFAVVEGHRDRQRQDRLYREGKSRVRFPDGMHNVLPSRAVDIAPYVSGQGVVWTPTACAYLAGYIKRVAEELGIALRWGGDWDGDGDMGDQSFNDLVHFELGVEEA